MWGKLIGAGLGAVGGVMAANRKKKHHAKQQKDLENYMKTIKKDPAEQRKIYSEDAQAGMNMTKGIINEAGGKDKVFEEYMGTDAAKETRANLQKGVDQTQNIYSQSQDVVSKSKEALSGYDSKEMQGMRSTAAAQRQVAEAEGARQAAGQMASSGMRGGRAAKAKAAAGLTARRDASQSERDLMVAQKQEQTRALGAYSQAVGASGSAANSAMQASSMLGQENRGQFDQAINQRQAYTGMLTTGATGMMSLGATDRSQQEANMANAMQMKMAQGPEPAGGAEAAIGGIASIASMF